MQWTLKAEKRLLLYATLAAIGGATWHFVELNYLPRKYVGSPEMDPGPTVYSNEIAWKSTLFAVCMWSAIPVLNAFIGLLMKSTDRLRPFTMVALIHMGYYALNAAGGAERNMYLYVFLVPMVGTILFVGIHFSALLLPGIRRVINAPFERTSQPD